MRVDNLTGVIDERDREVQGIVASINELAQVGGSEEALGLQAVLSGWQQSAAVRAYAACGGAAAVATAPARLPPALPVNNNHSHPA